MSILGESFVEVYALLLALLVGVRALRAALMGEGDEVEALALFQVVEAEFEQLVVLAIEVVPRLDGACGERLELGGSSSWRRQRLVQVCLFNVKVQTISSNTTSNHRRHCCCFVNAKRELVYRE